MSPDPALALLRDQVLGICVGTAFVVVGLVACAVAAVRRRGGVRVFGWLGTWSAIYGLQELLRIPAAVLALPRSVRGGRASVRRPERHLPETAAAAQAARGATFLVTSMTRELTPQLRRGRKTTAMTRWAKTCSQFLPSPPPLYSGAV